MGLSAPAEISIYVCTILYSCSFNKHIHYRATVINRAGEGEKMGEMKLCNRGEEEHTHTQTQQNNEGKDNDRVCRKKEPEPVDSSLCGLIKT